MPAADVQLIVNHVRPRHELRHEIHAVGAERTGRAFDLIARHETLGARRPRIDQAGRASDFDLFRHGANRKRERQAVVLAERTTTC